MLTWWDPGLMDGLVDGTQYAVTLTSAAPIGAVVNVYNAGGAPGAYSYLGLAQPATTGFRPAWAPFVTKTTEVGSSPIVIQNVGMIPACDVDLRQRRAAGDHHGADLGSGSFVGARPTVPLRDC